jgi:hypothetical protein
VIRHAKNHGNEDCRQIVYIRFFNEEVTIVTGPQASVMRQTRTDTLFALFAPIGVKALHRVNITADPIRLAGGINLFTNVTNNPINNSDPEGLETYRCRRPLGGKPGDNQRNGPDAPGNPFYHQYSCTRDASGKLACGGQGMLGKWWGSPGKPTSPQDDYYNPNACMMRIRGREGGRP